MAATWTLSKNEILATLQEVVAIDSVNPSLPGGLERGEAGMVDYLGAFFTELDIPYELSEALPGRNNIIARLRGQNPDRILVFECHMDTASAQVMTIPPFEPHIGDGLMYGRGSCDTKAGGVAMIHAMKRIKEAGIVPPMTIAYAGAVDEEHLMRGARHMAPLVNAEAAVIAEPTDLEVIRGHKGVVRFHITVHGKAAHSSKPYLGINAINKMARLIVRLEDELGPQYEARSDSLLGNPTFNVGIVEGGAQINFVPDTCRAAVDCRILPGDTAESVVGEFERVIAAAGAEDAELDARIERPLMFSCGAVGTAEDAPIVESTVAACRAVLGDVTIAGVPYGTDASPFADEGVPAVVLGPGSIDQAHGAVEWVECEQVLKAVDIYHHIMTNTE